ncbi:MAG: hypothetical protein QM708_14785 [Propioniciclava sp.]|uniref:hypothetical protein n=1 Tax=Propioniciclava sp. TaxID=2038686 RepID=UPI0039E6F1E1
MKTSHKIGLGLGTGALVLTGAAGFAAVAQAADPTASPTPAASGTEGQASGGQTKDRPDGRGKHGARGGKSEVSAAKLAEKLGLDEAKVSEALKTAREILRPEKKTDAGQEAGSTGNGGSGSTKPSRADRQAALAQALASALGVDEAKVTEALTAIADEQKAARAAELQTRLDEAVTAGTLTQAEADAVTKAVDAGVIGGGRR